MNKLLDKHSKYISLASLGVGILILIGMGIATTTIRRYVNLPQQVDAIENKVEMNEYKLEEQKETNTRIEESLKEIKSDIKELIKAR